LLLFFIFLVFPCFILLLVLVICAFFHICMFLTLLNNHINLFLSDNSGKKMLFILEKKVFLAKEYLLHLINKCSSSSTASQLHCLHILFSNPATNRNENKLRTYCKFKFIFQQEKYFDIIKELSNRSTLARFQISAHKLEIESLFLLHHK
jgi:hypothetical protein